MPRTKKPASPPPPHDLPADLLQAAVEQADIAISITDPRATIQYVNPAFSRTTGYSSAAAIGARHSLLASRTTPRPVYDAMWQTLTRREAWRGRLVNRREDGSQYLADLVITPLLDDNGNIVNFLGLHRDVTEMHRLECTVRNQKALIESVVDAAPLVLALLDLNDRVLLDNHAYKALSADLGMQEAAMVLLDAIRHERGNDFGPFRPGAHAFLGQQVRLDRPHWHSPRWYACSGVWVAAHRDSADAFFDEQTEACLLLVATDVSRRVMEHEKARVAALHAALAEEMRHQTLRESLAAAVYQMEGPLNVLESIVRLIGRRRCDPAQNALSEALQAGQNVLETLRRVIPPNHDEAPSTVNLNEAVRDILDLSAECFLSAGVSVGWQPQPLLPTLVGHPHRLRSMLKALVDNAIEAMNTKGWQRRELTIRTTNNAESITVEVADSGPGIPPEQRLKVFEPFWTTHQGADKHLGTGLSTAQQVVMDHGGSIELADAAHGGCLVTVVLPLKRSNR